MLGRRFLPARLAAPDADPLGIGGATEYPPIGGRAGNLTQDAPRGNLRLGIVAKPKTSRRALLSAKVP